MTRYPRIFVQRDLGALRETLAAYIINMVYTRELIQLSGSVFSWEKDLCISVKLPSGNCSGATCQKIKKLLLPVAVAADFWPLYDCQKLWNPIAMS